MARNETQTDIALESGLPQNLDAERFCLGAVLMDHELLPQVSGVLSPEDFTLESHRRIFIRMQDISARGDNIDRVTVANELRKHKQLEAVGGITYLVSLDEGLPKLTNLDSYVKIVKEKSKLRRLIFASRKVVDQALTEAESSEDIAAEAAKDLVELAERKDARGGPQLAYSIIEEDPGAFFESAVDQSTGLQTGFSKLDEMTGGLQKQDLIIIAGRPGMGKTAWAMNAAAHIAIREFGKVGVWSLEMTKKALMRRLVCSEARIDLAKFRAGYLSQDDRSRMLAAGNRLREVILTIEDRKSCNIVEIHASARKLKEKHGLDLVVIDYLQLMSQHTKTDNRARAIGEITKYIKTAICPDLDVPVVLLSQVNREGEKRTGDHKPRLSDLKESGSIEEDADLVAFCYRPEYYDKTREDLKGIGELLVEKNRSGPTGAVKLVFLKEFTKWENRNSDEGTSDQGD